MAQGFHRNCRTPYIKAVRSMTKDDIESVRLPSARVRIQNLREIHHIIARYLACGYSNTQIAELVGYTAVRIGDLRNAPAMAELVERYRPEAHAAIVDLHAARVERQFRMMDKADRIVEDYMDDHENNPIRLADALKIRDTFADRNGFHRKTATENTNVNFAVNLEKLRAKRKVKEISVNET